MPSKASAIGGAARKQAVRGATMDWCEHDFIENPNQQIFVPPVVEAR
jgi:hypothetical protein